MSTPALSGGGGGLFTGFTRLCKGLAVVLIGGHIVVQLFPQAVTYLALIPARTIPFGWNLITAGYIEQTIYGVVTSTIGLLFVGKLLEPIWGSKEFLKFIFIVNLLTSVCVFITAIVMYYVKMEENYLGRGKQSWPWNVGFWKRWIWVIFLAFQFSTVMFICTGYSALFSGIIGLYYKDVHSYMPISGFHGILLGFLVGIKQIMPDQELPILRIKTKWLPSVVLLLSIVASVFVENSAAYLPALVFGTYMSWIYLRYLQRRPETNLKGDPSDEFAFSTFFPEFLRPVINPIASIFHRMFCGRSDTSTEAKGYVYGDAPLSGSDPIEASRRRERGARALEERLAAERLAAARRAEESHIDASDEV